MNQLQTINESRVQVVVTWGMLYREDVSESDFINSVRELPLDHVLPRLVGLLQYCDINEPLVYEELDSQISHLFPSMTAGRIARRLSLGRHWIFFSQWQLLLAIKLVCTFSCRDNDRGQVTDNQLLKLLLMTNGFYPGGESAIDTAEDLVEVLRSTTLQGYSLIRDEQPKHLIGRYAELFGRLTAPEIQSGFNTWLDIRETLVDKLGIRLDTFKAVVLALASSTVRQGDEEMIRRPVRLNPETYFGNAQFSRYELSRILQLISTSPDEVREEYQSQCSNGIGNPVDLRFLLRKPAIRLSDGSLAGISGQLLIQRYTCGLYWDIHDALSNDSSEAPNRHLFQNFFGELHERYGRATLQRIEREQERAGKQVRLLSEEDYSSAEGSNPDSLLIETIGSNTTRCTLFEFKVGRPRYMDSIVEGNVKSFEKDLSRKVEEGFNQELEFAEQVMSGQRTVPGLSPRNIKAWLFVIVVTDPFPSMGMYLESLRKILTNSPVLGKTSQYGPFVLSLMELEQLETIPRHRVSQHLIDWSANAHGEWPFNTYYAYHTDSQAIPNRHISALAENEFEMMKIHLGLPESQ